MSSIFKLKRFTPNLFNSFFTRESDLLKGRWNIDYDYKVLDRKIYLTNMDNCGCCGHIKKERLYNDKDEEDILKYYIL